jgi:mRNA interferase MazF
MAGLRGEVRVVDLDPTRGHEQARTRPCIVVSDDRFNRSASGLVVVVPLTTVSRGIPWHVRVGPEDGGVREESFAMTDQVRSVTRDRLVGDPWGRVSAGVMAAIEERLRLLLGLA